MKVLNPGDLDLVLEPGDVVASIKAEKIPHGPEALSYTQVRVVMGQVVTGQVVMAQVVVGQVVMGQVVMGQVVMGQVVTGQQ